MAIFTPSNLDAIYVVNILKRGRSVEFAGQRLRRRRPDLTDEQIAATLYYALRLAGSLFELNTADPKRTLGDLFGRQ